MEQQRKMAIAKKHQRPLCCYRQDQEHCQQVRSLLSFHCGPFNSASTLILFGFCALSTLHIYIMYRILGCKGKKTHTIRLGTAFHIAQLWSNQITYSWLIPCPSYFSFFQYFTVFSLLTFFGNNIMWLVNPCSGSQTLCALVYQ